MYGMSLQKFLVALESSLDRLGPEGVRAAILRQGGTLQPGQRELFLAGFAQLPARAREEEGSGRGDVALLGDIADFRTRAEAGEFRDEEEWGEYGHADDSEWIGELHALFDAAGQAFLEGPMDLAAQAYRALFEILALDGDDTVFGYGEVAVSGRLDTDCREPSCGLGVMGPGGQEQTRGQRGSLEAPSRPRISVPENWNQRDRTCESSARISGPCE